MTSDQRRVALHMLVDALADELGTLAFRIFEMPGTDGDRLVAEHPSGRWRISILKTPEGWQWERYERPGEHWQKIEGWTP